MSEEFMRHALALAARGRGRVSPNPMVGAVLVKGRQVIAEGWHRRCGGDHAEIMALKKAGFRARGSTLYVTLEPCFHQGRTPPCVDALIRSGLKRVVVAMKDPNPLTNGQSLRKLRRAGIQVTTGVLRQQAQQLNEVFIKYITTGSPFVVAKSAQSLDGKIATVTGDSQWITSQRTRRYARKQRAAFDAILVGIATVLADNPRLEAPGKALTKIVLDTALRISPEARLFQGTAPGQCLVAVTDRAKARKKQLLRQKGVEIIDCPQKHGELDLRWLLRHLASRQISSILAEGGARVIGALLKEGLIDKMHVYIAPKILADQKALSAVVGRHVTKITEAIALRRLTVRELGEDILITGYPEKT